MDLARRRWTCWTCPWTFCIRIYIAGRRWTFLVGTHNRLVVGSIPTGPTKFRVHFEPSLARYEEAINYLPGWSYGLHEGGGSRSRADHRRVRRPLRAEGTVLFATERNSDRGDVNPIFNTNPLPERDSGLSFDLGSPTSRGSSAAVRRQQPGGRVLSHQRTLRGGRRTRQRGHFQQPSGGGGGLDGDPRGLHQRCTVTSHQPVSSVLSQRRPLRRGGL